MPILVSLCTFFIVWIILHAAADIIKELKQIRTVLEKDKKKKC